MVERLAGRAVLDRVPRSNYSCATGTLRTSRCRQRQSRLVDCGGARRGVFCRLLGSRPGAQVDLGRTIEDLTIW